MNKTGKTILYSLFFIIILSVLAWFFIKLDKSEQGQIIKETKNLFPFGNTGNRNTGNSNSGQGTVEENTNTDKPIPTEPTEPVEEIAPRLRKIFDQETAGFIGIAREEVKEIEDITINAEGKSVYRTRDIILEKDYVRFARTEDGSLYESKVDPYSVENSILIENYIPNIEHAYFSPQKADEFLYQYWNKDDRLIETYLGSIKPIEYTAGVCSTEFTTKIEIGTETEDIFKLHQFLNRTAQTRVSSSGVNSPGNESFLVTEATITAIKNFQSLHDLEIDGKIGPSTRSKMLDLCNKQEEKISEKEYNKIERKYTLSGKFLKSGIESISVHPEKNIFFYLLNTNNILKGFVQSFKGGEKEEIFTSPFTEWISQWGSNTEIELTTKAHSEVPGYSYSLNTEDNQYHKRIDSKNGLTTLPSPDKKRVLISEINDSGELTLSIHNRITGRSTELNIQTLVEKCTWSKNARLIYCAVPKSLSNKNYPDAWYQGRELFNDSLWKVNSSDFTATEVDLFENELNEEIDVEKIQLSQNGNYLYFINKDNEHLWSYRLLDA